MMFVATRLPAANDVAGGALAIQPATPVFSELRRGPTPPHLSHHACEQHR